MKQKFVLAIILNLIFIVSLLAQNKYTVKIEPQNSGAYEKILDGNWKFFPATENFKPADDQASISVKAKEISGRLNNAEGFIIKSPQFLNRTVWWLNNVSIEYEKQEDERIAALPKDISSLKAGWYYKEIDLTSFKKKDANEIIADFEGVATVSKVYFNGNYVGGHLGMFGAFQCRLTPFVKPGKMNNLLIYVERGVKSDKGDKVVSVAVTMPITRDLLTSLNSGMFGGFGNGPRAKFMGIWQPVKLLISQAGGLIDDVFFNPSLNGHQIEFTIKNPLKKTVNGTISYTVRDAKTGAMLAEDVLPEISLLAKGIKKVVSEKQALKPKLWSPDFPNLYNLEVVWSDTKGNKIDSWSMPVGYRTVKTVGEDVYLNGKPYWIRGAGQPIYGYKPTDTATAEKFLQLMHDGNTVYTRTGCNTWNSIWYGFADKIGVGVTDEGIRPWALMSTAPPPPKAILAQWKAEQLEVIKRYRNHPSILIYSISNEGLQGDFKNKEKQAIFKDIILAVRKLDPSRPIIQTSGDPDVAGNADIEDVHAYWGWYESSSFVNDYTKPMRGLTLSDGRPFVDHESAVPYSMIDDGSVHPAYVGRYAAQVWVGDIGTYAKGADVKYYQDHIYQEAKLKVEKLRYSRKKLPTAGVLLFANTTWIQNALSRPTSQWKPFPVYYGVQEAFQPVLAALETTQRNFFANQKISSKIYVVNDNAERKDLQDVSCTMEILEADKLLSSQNLTIGNVHYHDVKEHPIDFSIPGLGSGKHDLVIKLALKNQDKILSANHYKIHVNSLIFSEIEKLRKNILAVGVTEEIKKYAALSGDLMDEPIDKINHKADVIILGAKETAVSEAAIKKALKPGGRLIVLEQGEASHRFCTDVLQKIETEGVSEKPALDDFMYDSGTLNTNAVEKTLGEFVEMLNWKNRPSIFTGLDAMDWKWWAHGGNLPAYTSSASHKIDLSNTKVLALGRFLAPHFYWQGNLKKVYEAKIGYPVFAVKENWGDVLVSDLMITYVIKHDPRAAQTLINLINQPLAFK